MGTLLRLVTFVLTVLFWGWLALALPIFFFPALLIYLVTRPFDPHGRVLHQFTCFWCAQHLWTNPFWRISIEGRENVPPGRAFVLASNHASAGDIACLFATFLPFKFVSKAINFQVPFLGWNMRLNGYVELRRGDPASAQRMYAACHAWLARGVSIMMFPEGTRSRDGELLPFKRGAFQLAKDADVPVVPIVIEGTRAALPVAGVVRPKRTDIRVRIGAPIAASEYATVEELRDAVRARMIQMQGELRALGSRPSLPAVAPSAPVLPEAD
jgi:1-acyl-sn-glycerol-3-phosphate acyltransferase